MSKVTEQDSGVVGGTVDESCETSVSPPNEVIDAFFNRRHEATRRAAAVARLRRESRKQTPSASSGSK